MKNRWKGRIETLRYRLNAMIKSGINEIEGRKLRKRVVKTQYITAAEEFAILRMLREAGC